MNRVGVFALVGAVGALAACVPQREAPPPPQQPQRQPVQQQRIPPPPPTPQDWRDIPLTGGGWFYSSQGGTTQALFGPAGSEALFIVRCNRAARQVTLLRAGTTSGNTMTIRTSSSARNLPLSVQAEPLPYAYSTVAASDPILDAMAFSRGRFTIEVPGTPMLVIPAWPEPARVIEDCRR